MSKPRQVFFNSDARGIILLSVALYTLLKNARPDSPLTIFIACGQGFFEQRCDKRLKAIADAFPFSRLVFLDFDPMVKKYTGLLDFGLNKWSPLLWAMPLCTDLLPEDVHGNLVYIDIDMLIRKDLAYLYELPLAEQGMIAAAVNESRREHRPYLIAAGWPESAGYAFNNATLVIDIDTYRRERIPEQIIHWYAAHKDTAICVDQDSQNAIFGDRTIRLPLKWNYSDGWLERIIKCSPWRREWRVHPREEVLEAILDPAIIHYVGGRKPTGRTHRPERGIYRRTMREMGLIRGHLPEGLGLREDLEGTFFDIYHAFLRLYVHLLRIFIKCAPNTDANATSHPL